MMSSSDLVLYVELGFLLGIIPSVVIMLLGKLWRVIDIID